MFDNQFFAQQGWQCPICKRVYSPFTPCCFSCGAEGKTYTSTGTGVTDIDWQKHQSVTTVVHNSQEGCWELLPAILTSYPPKHKWQCKRCGHEVVTDDLSYPEFPCEKCGAGSKGGTE